MQPKMKYALIGCGVVAKKHLRAAIHSDDILELVAIADTNADNMQSLLSMSNLGAGYKSRIKCFTDAIEMMDNIKPDVVSITTPSGTHYMLGIAAIERGIHILIEKPMTLIPAQARALNELAEKNNVKIALGHIYRYFPIVNLVARDISAGKFGQVLYGDVKVFWGHAQTYYNQAKWRGTWAQDGGVLMNQSIHALDLMNYLMGTHPVEAVAMTARQIHDMEAEDLGMGVLRMANGSFCTITGTTNTDPSLPEASFYILCTRGVINAGIRKGTPFFSILLKDSASGKMKKANSKYIFEYAGYVIRNFGFGWIAKLGKPHSWILRDLCQSIANDVSPRADGLSGEISLLAVEALYYSSKDKASVTLPLDDARINAKFEMELPRIF